jgi:hypothetical protein
MPDIVNRQRLIVASPSAFNTYVDTAIARAERVWAKSKVTNMHRGNLATLVGENQSLTLKRIDPSGDSEQCRGFNKDQTGVMLLTKPNKELLRYLQTTYSLLLGS